MKKLIKNSKNIFLVISLLLVFSMSIVLASNQVQISTPFEYNIIPETKNNSAIDTTHTKELSFRLFEHMDKVFYNNKLVDIKDDLFTIDVEDLKGELFLEFRNDKNEVSRFKYFFSDEDGKLENYKLVEESNIAVYIKTHKNIQILYTKKEESAMNKLINYIDMLPEKVLSNLKVIKMIPFDNTSNIAGVTKDSTITLYKFSKYAIQTQKNIIFHEIGHTFANKLMEEKIIDYSYTNYEKAVKEDASYVSSYSKRFTKENGRLSEDFADSFAFYFISSNFENKYPNRASYLKSILEK